MDQALLAGSIPAPLTPAAETRFLFAYRVIDRERIPVEEAGTTRVALFGEDHTNTYKRRLVGEQVNQLGMRDLHKLLIVLLAHLHLLLPERVLANDDGSDAFLYQEIDDATAGRVQVVQDTAIALRRDPIELARREAVRFGKALLVVSTLLVVQLVDSFDRAAIDQARDKAGLVGGERGQHVDAQIHGDKQIGIDRGGVGLVLVDHLDHVVICLWHNAHLIDGLPGLCRLDQDAQAAHRNHAPVQIPLPDRAQLIDQQIAPGGFVLVPRELRATGELLGVLLPGLHRFKEAEPGFVQLDEHLIADFPWKGLIGFMGLDLVKDLNVIQVDAVMNEGLAHEVIRCIPQILRGKGGLIDGAVARVTALDDMLLHELHYDASP